MVFWGPAMQCQNAALHSVLGARTPGSWSFQLLEVLADPSRAQTGEAGQPVGNRAAII